MCDKKRGISEKQGRITIEAGDVGGKESSVLTGINALVRGSSTRLLSSRRLGWSNVGLEHHRASPAEREESVSPHHLIALFTNHVSRGERSVARGHFVPYSCSPGDISLSPPGPIGVCRPFTHTTMIICALDPKFVNEVGEELDTPSTTEFRCALNLRERSLEGIITLLAAEAESGGSSGKLYTDHLAHALAMRLLWVAGGIRDANPLQYRTWPQRVLRRVLDRMEAELTCNLDLNTLAAESGYSRSHFLRIFRAGMGCSPHEWLTQLRVEKAKKMLREDSASLIDIAASCGFCSHSHFSRTFRQIAGLTPDQYRRTRDLFVQKRSL
jgi:AraC family transcriptional regulator